ncbi:high affinity immunoglobulin epsilon receptor subunit gamma-like [Engraulis encrasicolus]|uniref:high affinity immunoglobulin epsilon receptor subunit gamma-like n=1 Tax=Engraulis encrasicolus TaxID=184585 RepID=UPI002FCFFD2F
MKLAGVIVLLSLYVHGVSAGLEDGKLCYILDAVLVLYGIVLTVLYFRLRMRPERGGKPGGSAGAGDGIYQDLTPRAQDTYESIQVPNKKA